MPSDTATPLPASPRVFIVEDEAPIAMMLEARLGQLGCIICGTAVSGEAALARIGPAKPDVALVDVHLTGQMDGVELARRLRRTTEVAVIFLSAAGDAASIERAGETEPFGYLVKPVGERELHAAIRMALQLRRMARALREANDRLETQVRARTAELAAINAQLARSEHELRDVWNSTSEAMRITDRDGTIKRVNPAFCRLFRVPEAEVVGQPMHLVYPPGREAHYLDQHRTRFDLSETKPEIETLLVLRAGGAIWAAVSHRVLPAAAGTPGLLLTTFRDITGRKRAEAARQESEDNLAITLNSIGDGVLVTDGQGRIARLNPVAETLTGWTTAAAAGRPVAEVFHVVNEQNRAPSVIPVVEVLRDGKIVELTNHTVLIARDGTERPIASSAAPIRSHDDDRIRGVVLVFRDQTRERAAQRTIRERERLLSSINENLVGSFVYRVTFSPAGRMSCSYISPSIEEITGLPAADFLANAEVFYSLLLTEDMPLLKERVTTSIQTDHPLDVEIRLMHARNRGLRWLRLRGRNVERLADGSMIREGIAIDVTAARETEAENRKLALVAARTANSVVLTDAHRRIEWVNEGFTRMTGYTLDEVRGRVPGSILQGPETDQATVVQIRAALRTGREVHVELLNYAKDGRKYWVDIEIQPLRDANGRLTHFMAIDRDITDRKTAEEEVRQLNASLETQVRQRTETLALSEERFRRLAENIRDLLCMIDETGRFAYVSQSFHTILHYFPEDLLGGDPIASVHPEDVASVAGALQIVLGGGPAQSREFRFRHKAGHFVWVEAIGSTMRLPDGTIRGCVVTARDITERKEAAARLRDSEQRYADLVENIHDAIIRDDVNGRLVFANRRFIDWCGFAGRDLHTLAIEDCVAPEWRETLRDRHDRRMRGEKVPDRFEYEGVRVDGHRMWLDAFVTPVLEHGQIVGTQSVLRDITARKQAELISQAVLRKTALVVGEEFYRTLAFELGRALDVAMVCIARLTGPGRIHSLAHYSNGQMLEPAEFEMPPGHPCEAIVIRGEPVFIESGVRQSSPSGVFGRFDIESYYGHPLREGTQPVQGLLIVAHTRTMRFEPLQFSLLNILATRAEAEFLREQTESEKAEMQSRLFQSQKYEALGTLAGGVAHDFNNILTGVINYTALAQMDCPPSLPQVAEYLGEVLKCGHRAKELVRQILIFSRSEDAVLEPLRIQNVVKEALSLLRSTIPTSIEITGNLDQDAPPVQANATQIHQIVMNLGINAAHAMPAQKGVLAVRLDQRLVDQFMIRSLPELKPGPHVRLEISDTGCGMEPAVLARIFEPFFTTKKVGEGTGLGLSVVHSVVQNHHGAIRVRSQPGVGTTFEIFLPVHGAEPAAVAATQPATLACGEGRHILLIDDEAAVGRSVKLALERLGFHVTAIFNPLEALAHFERSPDDFDAVVTDLQMPDLPGFEFAKKLLERRPQLPVFVASGYAGKIQPSELRKIGVRGFFQKPIDLELMTRTLADLPPRTRS